MGYWKKDWWARAAVLPIRRPTQDNLCDHITSSGCCRWVASWLRSSRLYRVTVKCSGVVSSRLNQVIPFQDLGDGFRYATEFVNVWLSGPHVLLFNVASRQLLSISGRVVSYAQLCTLRADSLPQQNPTHSNPLLQQYSLIYGVCLLQQIDLFRDRLPVKQCWMTTLTKTGYLDLGRPHRQLTHRKHPFPGSLCALAPHIMFAGSRNVIVHGGTFAQTNSSATIKGLLKCPSLQITLIWSILNRFWDAIRKDRNWRFPRLWWPLRSTQMSSKYPCSCLGRNYAVDTGHRGIGGCFVALWICRSRKISYRSKYCGDVR